MVFPVKKTFNFIARGERPRDSERFEPQQAILWVSFAENAFFFLLGPTPYVRFWIWLPKLQIYVESGYTLQLRMVIVRTYFSINREKIGNAWPSARQFPIFSRFMLD